jgi:hypothetical protein
MVSETCRRFNPKARVPFSNQLAREFKRSKCHVWMLCTGARSSPLRERMLARQAELIRAVYSAASLPGGHAGSADPVQPAGKAAARPSSAS